MRSLSAVRFLSTSKVFKKDDIISDLFLKQIRDLAAKQKAAGGSLVNSSPDIKKQLDEQLNRLAQKFKIANADVVGKLNVDFLKPNVESSVNAVTEGKTLDELMNAVNVEQAQYLKKREEKKRIEQEQQKAMAGAQ